MKHITSLQRIRIWDLPTRVFHIFLALSVFGLIITGEMGGDAMRFHFWLGYAVLTLILFRLVWGFVGGRWSRFIHFVPMPSQLLTYAYAIWTKHTPRSVGHNPWGALSVLGMLGLLLLQVLSGFMSDDEIANTGPWVALVPSRWVSLATTYHSDIGKMLLIVLIALHVATVLSHKYIQRDDLVTPMLTGDKTLPVETPSSRDTLATRLFALSLLATSAYVVYRLVNLG